MHCRRAIHCLGFLVLASSCTDAPSILTGNGTERATDLNIEPGAAVDVQLHHSKSHDMRIHGGHLVIDGKDHGRINATARAHLIATFLSHDSALVEMTRLRNRGLARVKLRPAKRSLGLDPNQNRLHLQPRSTIEKITPRVPSRFFELGRMATAATAKQPMPARSPSIPLAPRMDVTYDNSWCSESYENAQACYYFLVDFQSAQDGYVAARETQMNGFLEWVQDEGSDTFQDMFSEMLSEMAGEEASAYAEALVSAFEFYTQVVDVYETEQLITVFDALNVDVWVGNTLGTWADDWSIDCGEEDSDIYYPDVCGDLNEE